MKRTAITALTASVAVAALLTPHAFAKGDPQASASAEPLVSFVGSNKLKVGKRIDYAFVCSVACNISVRDQLTGPRIKQGHSVSGSLQPGVTGTFGGKPNGPLLSELKDNPGRFKLAVTISASNPLTGETDIDKRTYKFK